jgi:hypothetical protein
MLPRLAAATAAVAVAAAAASAPLSLTTLPAEFAQQYGAACLDGTPPAFYSLVQDPTKWILFLEGGTCLYSMSAWTSVALSLYGLNSTARALLANLQTRGGTLGQLPPGARGLRTAALDATHARARALALAFPFCVALLLASVCDCFCTQEVAGVLTRRRRAPSATARGGHAAAAAPPTSTAPPLSRAGS